MNKSDKIAAFTMVDILTGMVITSIIISMVFYLFMALNKQVADYGQTRNELNGFLLLKTDLKRQFEKNRTIKGIPYGFELNLGTDLISYRKEGSYFLRENTTQVDTLSTNLERLEIQFVSTKNNEITETVKQIVAVVDVNGLALEGHFYKDFGIVHEINQTLLHEF